MAPVSTLSFNTALITGGGGGLGKAMAQSLISQGKTVIIAGRTESTLRETAREIGAAAYYVLDTGDTSSIAPFIDKITQDHPSLDCVINNAGVQRPFQILGPDYAFDLARADQELSINIRGPLHLCVGLIQRHFQHLDHGAVIMNVSSVLGFNPSSVINPVYNGTKAWLHFFTLNLRTQLAKLDPSNKTSSIASTIKVVEIAPPSVETALHRERHDPDDNKRSKGSKTAMTVDEFMAEVQRGWEQDRDIIAPGMAGKAVEQWERGLGGMYAEATK